MIRRNKTLYLMCRIVSLTWIADILPKCMGFLAQPMTLFIISLCLISNMNQNKNIDEIANGADINWHDRSEYIYKIEQHNGTSSYHTGSTTHICDFIINLHLLFCYYISVSGNMCIISQVISSIPFCISMWIMKLDGFNAPWVRYLFMRSI